MRKVFAAAALTAALGAVPALDPVVAQAPAQQQADEDDDGDGGNWGLLGLIGLLGLAGLAGLRRRDDHRTTGTTMTGTAPRTTEGATSSGRLP
jgi:MYXO-CTERM domain-containing protein